MSWVAINFAHHMFTIDSVAGEFAKLLIEQGIDGRVIILKDDGKNISAVGWKND